MPASRSPAVFGVFLDRPVPPVVPWVQWIREFNLFLAAERCSKDEDRKSTLLRNLGREGRRVLLSLQSPRNFQNFWFDGTETYEQMVSALTAHYEREIMWKHLRIFLYFLEAGMFIVMMCHLCRGKYEEAFRFAVVVAVLKAVLFIWEVVRCVGTWGSRLLHTVALWLDIE